MKFPFIFTLVRGLIIAVLITIMLFVMSVLTQAQTLVNKDRTGTDRPNLQSSRTANGNTLSTGEIMGLY